MMNIPTHHRDALSIQGWLVQKLAERLGLDPAMINISEPFADYGLDSAEAVSLAGELELWLGMELAPTIAYEYPSIAALSQHLAQVSAADTRILRSTPIQNAEPIAIIGIGCRLPGAQSPLAFWHLLRDGVDAIQMVPDDRWDIPAFYDPDPHQPGKLNTRWGGFLEHIDQFDSTFFKIPPREATRMDPQQRLLLEVTWEALEDAGLTTDSLANSHTGVFVGISSNEYSQLQFSAPALIDAYAGTGNALSIAANRLSYTFDLRGPSVSIDTACSSSLVAAHLACQSIRHGESQLAIVGGCNLLLSPAVTINFTKAGVMAADGRCKAFDARADGYVRSEGVGVVVLKPLSHALRDGDSMYAVIRGSAVNQDGRSNGLMAPNREAQETVLRQAYAQAGIHPGHVDYIEAHGTGTILGDAIEVNALGSVIGAHAEPGHICRIGSVKTNIGHLEAAAGIAGLIKVALALKHRTLPASLHFHQPNPHIAFEHLPLQVQQDCTPWPATAHPARAGVSSFGFGGTNAHMVLEEGPSQTPAQLLDQEPDIHLLTLSAVSLEALHEQARTYRAMVSDPQFVADARLHHVCYSANVRRSHLDHRLACVVTNPMELVKQLTAFVDGQTVSNVVSGSVSIQQSAQVVFVFPGQGSQWVGMGQSLLAQEPIVRDILTQCDHAMQQYVTWSLLEQLTASQTHTRLDEIDVVQPMLFAIQIALAALWQSWGISPTALVGHSMGEVAAAYVAGILNLDDAARIICLRSQLLRHIAGLGSMVAVEMDLTEAQQALIGYEDRVSIAAANSPTSVVLSGDTSALQELLERFEQLGLFCRHISVDVASHSPQTEVLHPDLLQALANVHPQDAQVPFYSTVTGQRCAGPELDAHYWVRNLREPVLFSQVTQQLLIDGTPIFLEISPHPILLSAIQQSLHHAQHNGRGVPSLRRNENEYAVLLKSLGELYVRGIAIDWRSFYAQGGHFTQLPTYPWQHESFWFATPESEEGKEWQHVGRSRRTKPIHPFEGKHIHLATPASSALWETEINKQQFAYLNDHKVQHVVLLPGTAYLELALAAAMSIFQCHIISISDTTFQRALFWPDQEPRTVQVIFGEVSTDVSYQIYSRPTTIQSKQQWTCHATGTLRFSEAHDSPLEQPMITLHELQQRCQELLFGVDYYLDVWEAGIQYGPAFQSIQYLWRHGCEALGQLAIPGMLVAHLDQYHIHPAVLDACLQVLGATLPTDSMDNYAGIYLPVFIDQVRLYGSFSKQLWSYACLRSAVDREQSSLTGDIWVFDDTGTVIIEIEGICLQRLDRVPQTNDTEQIEDWLYEICWQVNDTPLDRDPDMTPLAGTWIIFADQKGVARALADRLTQAEVRAVLVFPSDIIAQSSLDSYSIRPDNANDMAHLIDTVFGDVMDTERFVVYLWGLDTPTLDSMTAADLTQSQRLGCPSLLLLVQALAQRPGPVPPRLWVITTGVQPIDTQCQRLAVAQAPLWGFGRTIAQEHGVMWGGLIDLDPSADVDTCATWLWRLLHQTTSEDQFAIRQDQCYLPRLVPKPPASAPALTLRWRADGSYLITGGLGDLGLQMARWMVVQGARRLILMSRSGLPARNEWKQLAADNPQSQRIAVIRELEALGASVHIATVDIADSDQVASFFATYEAEAWPPICGVVHAAGVAALTTISELDIEEMQRVLRPKVMGAWLLHHYVEHLPLDFFILFSSATTLLGSPRLAHYAAANTFLDALAHDRYAHGLTAVSINWGLWGTVGMAARQLQENEDHVMLRGIESFTPEQGLEVLETVLRQSWPQVGVMRVNWQEWRQQYPVFSQAPLFSQLGRSPADTTRDDSEVLPTSEMRAALLKLPVADQQEQVESYLSEQVAAVLGMSATKLDRQQPFNMLGVDSIMAVELKHRIETNLGISIPIVSFIQGPSITQLSTHILDHIHAENSSITLREHVMPGSQTDQS